jgi:hypothetical protein
MLQEALPACSLLAISPQASMSAPATMAKTPHAVFASIFSPMNRQAVPPANSRGRERKLKRRGKVNEDDRVQKKEKNVIASSDIGLKRITSALELAELDHYYGGAKACKENFNANIHRRQHRGHG